MKSSRYPVGRSLILAALLLSGCATVFKPQSISRIRPGMAREQVIQFLGQPDYVTTDDSGEQLHYVYREDYNPSLSSEPFYDMDTDRAFRELTTDKAFQETHYVVILMDGVVQTWHEL